MLWTSCCAASVAVGELTPRTTDYVVSFGERLSSKLVTTAFLAHGMRAVLVDARDVITDAAHTRAIPQIDEINDRLALLVARCWPTDASR